MQVKLNTDIRVLTMDKFIDCFVNNNLKCLIIEGEPTEKELSEAWEGVWIEYCDLQGSSNYKQIVYLLKDIGVNEWRLVLIDMCLVILSRQYSETCVNILRDKLGFNYKFDLSNVDEYLSDLEKVKASANSSIVSLKRNTNELEKLKNSAKKSTTIADFDKIFISLSKYMGYSVRSGTTTVSEYCSMIALMSKK